MLRRNCLQLRKKNNPFSQSLKYLQNKIWKINKRGRGGPDKGSVRQNIQKLISKGGLLFGTEE